MFCFNKKLKIKNKEKESLTGFTILELIVAIFVMTVGVLGAYAVVQQIIVYNSISSSRLTAAYLAQEGIELVRNIRDTNWLDPVNPLWDDGISNKTENNLLQKYTRKTAVTSITSDSLKVVVEISWTEKGQTHTVTVQENLYNWF